MSYFNVTESFFSIQGEGRYVGSASLFVRLSSCNLKCRFCDSKYSWSKGEQVDFLDLLDQIVLYKPESIVFTGGEPLLQQHKIADFLSKHSKFVSSIIKRVEIETNGTIGPVDGFRQLESDIDFTPKIVFNVSPKMLNSGNGPIDYQPSLSILKKYNSIFKFVDTDVKSEKEIEIFVDQMGINPYNVYIMPEGLIINDINKRVEDVVKFCLDNKFKFCHRVHVLIWNDKKGV